MLKNREHGHAFICGLIYPAFLGAMIYEFFTELGKHSPLQVGFILLIFAVYTFDFLYTNDCYGKDRYNRIRVILDVILVSLVYMGAKAAMEVPDPSIAAVFFWMAGFKLLNFLWECFPKENQNVEWIPLLTYLMFFVLYIVGCLAFPNPYVLSVVLLADATVSYVWDEYETKLKGYIGLA